MKWRLSVTPFQVQMNALQAAYGKPGFGYFLEMGLGKTAVTLAEFIDLHLSNKVDGLIVICPNSLKKNWLNEADKMGVTLGTALAWPSRMASRPATPWLFTMNYEAVITRDGFSYLSSLLATKRCMLVLDESTQIKNPQAKRSKTLIALSKFATYRRVLSGAPITQGPQDLWAQMRFLGFLSGVNFYAYRNTFCVMGGWQGKQIVGVKNEERLNALIKECGYRANKKDWLDLPEKIYQSRYVTHTPHQKKHYKEMVEILGTSINQKVIDVTMVLTQMQKLQQIGSGFIIDKDGVAHPIPGTNPKLEIVQEILEDAPGKTIIFTHYTFSGALLKSTLGVKATFIHGGMKPGEVSACVDRFNNDPSCRVIIAQIQSGKYGLTLLGGADEEDRCTTTIFYENSFSLDARIQAEDRNHRIGQKSSVVYIDLIGSEIDELAIKALRDKKHVADVIVDGLRRSK